MRREVELLFDDIVRQDRNVVDLLTAKYTFVNERLAKHYGIENVKGARFRRVLLAEPAFGVGHRPRLDCHGNRLLPRGVPPRVLKRSRHPASGC